MAHGGPRQKQEEFVTTINRRQVLRVLGGSAVVATAGCTRVARLNPLRSGPSTDWPLMNHDINGRRYLRTNQGPVPESPPDQRWKSAEVAYTPVIADETMFVHRVDNGIAALDPVSGTTRWVTEVELVANSPAVRNGTLYATTLEGVLLAVDAETGERRWSVDLPQLDGRAQFPGVPVADDGRVYLLQTAGKREQMEVFVADGATGDRVWRQRIEKTSDEEGVLGGFYTVAVGDGTAVVTAGPRLVAYDKTTGERKWERPVDTPGNLFSTSPTIADGSVYAAIGEGSLLRLALDTGAVEWRATVPDEIQRGLAPSSLAVDGECVYLASKQLTDPPIHRGTVRCFERETGAEIWKTVVEGTCRAQPAITERTAYLATLAGYIYAIDTETGETRWRVGDSTEAYDVPCVITENAIYTTDHRVQCWR